MTLASIAQQKLSEAKPAAGRHELSFSDEGSGWSLYLTAERRDELSVLAWEISLRRPDNGGDVGSWATRLAETATALDRLKVIEVDAPRRQALIRSAVPTRRQDRLFFYEVILHGADSALIRRYKASQQGDKREQIAFALTHEALARLIEEFTA